MGGGYDSSIIPGSNWRYITPGRITNPEYSSTAETADRPLWTRNIVYRLGENVSIDQDDLFAVESNFRQKGLSPSVAKKLAMDEVLKLGILECLYNKFSGRDKELDQIAWYVKNENTRYPSAIDSLDNLVEQNIKLQIKAGNFPNETAFSREIEHSTRQSYRFWKLGLRSRILIDFLQQVQLLKGGIIPTEQELLAFYNREIRNNTVRTFYYVNNQPVSPENLPPELIQELARHPAGYEVEIHSGNNILPVTLMRVSKLVEYSELSKAEKQEVAEALIAKRQQSEVEQLVQSWGSNFTIVDQNHRNIRWEWLKKEKIPGVDIALLDCTEFRFAAQAIDAQFNNNGILEPGIEQEKFLARIGSPVLGNSPSSANSSIYPEEVIFSRNNITINYAKMRVHQVSRMPALLKNIETPTDQEIDAALHSANQLNPGDAIRYLKNPSESVQLEAVRLYGPNIEYIKQPTEKVQIESLVNDADNLALRHLLKTGQISVNVLKVALAKRRHVVNPVRSNALARWLSVNSAWSQIKYSSEPLVETVVAKYDPSESALIEEAKKIILRERGTGKDLSVELQIVDRQPRIIKYLKDFTTKFPNFSFSYRKPLDQNQPGLIELEYKGDVISDADQQEFLKWCYSYEENPGYGYHPTPAHDTLAKVIWNLIDKSRKEVTVINYGIFPPEKLLQFHRSLPKNISRAGIVQLYQDSQRSLEEIRNIVIMNGENESPRIKEIQSWLDSQSSGAAALQAAQIIKDLEKTDVVAAKKTESTSSPNEQEKQAKIRQLIDDLRDGVDVTNREW